MRQDAVSIFSLPESITVAEQQRLYESEHFLKQRDWDNHCYMTLKQSRVFVDMVIDSPYVRTRFLVEQNIKLLRGRYEHPTSARYVNDMGQAISPTDPDGTSIIITPRWARTKSILLYEIAHHLHGYKENFWGDKWLHDQEFALIMLGLVEEFLSSCYQELEESYINHGIIQ